MTEKDPRVPMVERIAKTLRRSATGSEEGWHECLSAAQAVLQEMEFPSLVMQEVTSVTVADLWYPQMIRAALGEPVEK